MSVRNGPPQKGLRVTIIEFDGCGGVVEGKGVSLLLERTHGTIRVHHRIRRIQPQRVRVCRGGRDVVAGAIMIVSLVLLVKRAPLDLDARHGGEGVGCHPWR